MPIFIVLHIAQKRPTAARKQLAGRIASLLSGAYLQLDCIWLVHCEDMADELRDRLSAGLPPEDALVVVEIGDQLAWQGLTEEQAEWLLNHPGNTEQEADGPTNPISHFARLLIGIAGSSRNGR